MTIKKSLHRYAREREKHAAEVAKLVGKLQKNFAKTNTRLMGDVDVNNDDKNDFLEERALDQMQEMLEMQQRLDSVQAGVTVKVASPEPRPPEAIMQEAQQLNDRLAELNVEFAAWQALQPVETAH